MFKVVVCFIVCMYLFGAIVSCDESPPASNMVITPMEKEKHLSILYGPGVDSVLVAGICRKAGFNLKEVHASNFLSEILIKEISYRGGKCRLEMKLVTTEEGNVVGLNVLEAKELSY